VNVVFHSASIVLGPLGMALGSTLAEITSARLTFLVAGSAMCLLAVALTGWALRPGAKAARTREQIRVDLTDRRGHVTGCGDGTIQPRSEERRVGQERTDAR